MIFFFGFFLMYIFNNFVPGSKQQIPRLDGFADILKTIIFKNMSKAQTAASMRYAGVVHGIYPRSNPSPAHNIDALHTYLASSTCDPLKDYIPTFSSVFLSGSSMCMILPYVHVPFSIRCCKKGRQREFELSVANSLASVVQKLALYYLHIGPNKPFLALLDFSLMNIGIDVETQQIQFIDLESFEVIDGCEGTFMVGENVINGYHILTEDMLDCTKHSTATVHRRLQLSTILMFMIMAVKASKVSQSETISKEDFMNSLRRPAVSDDDIKFFVGEFCRLFDVDMLSILKAVENGSPCDPSMPLNLLDNCQPTTGHRRKQEHVKLNRVLKRFTTSYRTPLMYVDGNIVLFDRTASAIKLASGSFGTIIRSPLKVPDRLREDFVMKVWSHVIEHGPTCRMCTHTTRTIAKHNLVHYCHYCQYAVCRKHLSDAIVHGKLHKHKCTYIADV
mgnify:CR=1 FL=1